MSQQEFQDLKNEVAMISEVDHPHIVKYYETYDDTKYIYLVMELCTGGELFSRMISGKHVDQWANLNACVHHKYLQAMSV